MAFDQFLEQYPEVQDLTPEEQQHYYYQYLDSLNADVEYD